MIIKYYVKNRKGENMKEIFTEEEYQEAVKLYNEQARNDFYSNKEYYSNYEGYADLRDFDMSEDDFKMLWRCQDLLYNYEHSNNGSLITQKAYNEIKSIYLNCFNGA